jgi:integrase
LFEERVLAFLVSERAGQGLAAGSVNQRVYAIRVGLLAAGFGDVLEFAPRVRVATKALKRVQGEKEKKIPVTIGMLNWLADNLHLGQDGTPRDHDEVRVWIAIVLGYFFLLRVSELLELRQEDVQARRGDEWCTDWQRADSVTVLIRGSKTDQYNLGCLRSQHRVGGTLCPVGVMKMWGSLAHGDEPIFDAQGPHAKRDGRTRIQNWLRVAAAAVGLPAHRVGTHSLRIGGATALYNAGWELGAIQRFGRWASNSFHGYLWDSHSLQKGAAKAMSSNVPDLHLGILRPATGEAAARVNPSGRSAAWAQAVQKMY